MGSSPYGRQTPIAAGDANVNKAEKMLWSTKRPFDTLPSSGRRDLEELPETMSSSFGSSRGGKQMSLLKGRLWEDRRRETVILLCSSSALS